MAKPSRRFSRLKITALIAATVGGAGWLGVTFDKGKPLFVSA